MSLSGHHKKWGVVGGKDRWIPSQDRGNGGVALELLIQKLANLLPIPSSRMFKVHIEREVTFIEHLRFEVHRIWPINREIEYRYV